MKNLREMTAKELKEIAKEMKISNWWNLKKEVLIEKIEAAQNMTDEEKQAIEDQRAKEDAAIAEYTKDWKKYTKRYNVSEFLMKWKSGEIVLESEKSEEAVVEEEIEVQEEVKAETKKETLESVEKPIEEEKEIEPFIYIDKYDTEHDIKPEPKKKEKKPSEGVKKPSLKIKEITYKGETKSIREWAEELGMDWPTLYDRINRNGWTVEEAIETPLGQRRKKK